MISGNPRKRKKAFSHLKTVAALHPNRDQLRDAVEAIFELMRDDDSIAMDDGTDDYLCGIYLALKGQTAR